MNSVIAILIVFFSMCACAGGLGYMRGKGNPKHITFTPKYVKPLTNEQIVAIQQRAFSVGTSTFVKCTKVNVTERISDTKTITYEACKEDVK